jgi:hypothetical protein
MKNNFGKEIYLKILYVVFLAIITLLFLTTPFLMKKINFIEEEYAELIFIALLFLTGYTINFLYQREIAKRQEEMNKIQKHSQTLEERLDEAFKYIGSVNVQIQEIKSAFTDIKKYPENKKDFKYIIQFMAEKILAMTNVGWLMLRIIDTEDKKTLREHCAIRGGTGVAKCSLGNEDIFQNNIPTDLTVIKSTQENFIIKTACILPKDKISNEQAIMIRAILNQVEMLFLIFTSNYYKDTGKKISA